LLVIGGASDVAVLINYKDRDVGSDITRCEYGVCSEGLEKVLGEIFLGHLGIAVEGPVVSLGDGYRSLFGCVIDPAGLIRLAMSLTVLDKLIANNVCHGGSFADVEVYGLVLNYVSVLVKLGCERIGNLLRGVYSVESVLLFVIIVIGEDGGSDLFGS
jgi:hypothetical protein